MVTETLIKPQIKNLDTPDAVKDFPRGRAMILTLGDRGVVYLELVPGWRWSRDIKPLINTESCTVPHLQYVLNGRLRFRMDDGTELELAAGDIAAIPPGHDAWVVGDEPFVALDLDPEMLHCVQNMP